MTTPIGTVLPPKGREPVTDGPPPPPPPAHPQPVASGRAARHVPPLTAGLALTRSTLVVVSALAGALVLQITVVSALGQRADQQRLYDRFRSQLAEGTAPVSPVAIDGEVLAIGDPVAYLEIPEIGLEQVVVSGTTSAALFNGPGHRRDTVLPGQAGVSVVMGRSAAYGGPFGSIEELGRGDRIEVTTGQNEYAFEVVGVRREGDPLPDPIEQDEGRLVLVTADGTPFLPDGVVRVDADLVGQADPGGGRLFGPATLPSEEANMAGDTSQLWALALWLQALTLVALGAVWAWHRWGRPQTWVVFLPALLFVGMFVADQAARLLPNML